MGDDSATIDMGAPDMGALLLRMLMFLLPVTALVLSEPLLGLCTSMFIGQYASTLELAALGPANIVICEAHAHRRLHAIAPHVPRELVGPRAH
jgi:hypothetical protein